MKSHEDREIEQLLKEIKREVDLWEKLGLGEHKDKAFVEELEQVCRSGDYAKACWLLLNHTSNAERSMDNAEDNSGQETQ